MIVSRTTCPEGQVTRLAAALAALAIITFAPSAQAQEPVVSLDRAASDGIDRPIKDYSGEGDASSLELNPALLSAIRGLDAVIMGYRPVSAFTRGGGFGGFMGVNLGLGFATGLGIQAVRPGLGGTYFDERRPQNPDFTKVSWGLSGGDGKVVALGIGLHWMLDRRTALRRPDLDVGLLVRLRNHASLGATMRLGPTDLTPQGTLVPEMSAAAELAIRPLGTRVLELAGGVRARWRGTDMASGATDFLGVLPRGRVAFRHEGIEIAGELEQVRANLLGRDTLQRVGDAKALRGSIALAVAWDFVSLRAGLHAGLGDGVDGVGLAARFSSSRQGRVFWPRLVEAERIDVSGVRDERGLIRMLERLDRAEQAGPRAILLIDARATGLGWASLQELRAALVRVRNAGGHVFAYLEDTKLKDYYLASAAEQVYIHPAGEVAAYGLASTTMYFKAALEKLGVQVEGLHIDEYKSAHEPFTRTSPSDPDRAQREAILDDTFSQIVQDLAQARGLSQSAVRALIDEAPHGPDQALRLRLVDKIVHRDEVIDAVSAAVGTRVRFVPFGETDHELPTWSSAPYLAAVLIEGTIIDGESRTIPFLNIQFTGGDTLVKQLRTLRADPMCKGIILRVNSPGGSALASDVIWREVARTQEAFVKNPKKSPPIVVSMGDVAASGGYYVAMGARTIFASSMTLTGSIGVVSLHFDLSALFTKLGISTTTFQRGKNADIASIYKPYTDDQRARMDASMRRVYDLFRGRVAEGRKLTIEQVDQLGRGHVYSGTDAHGLKLIDKLGGLHEAIAAVRTSANLPPRRDIEMRVFPRQRRLVDIVLEQVVPQSQKGLRTSITERAASAARARQQLPLALDAALSRLPLALLFLPQDQALALLPGIVEVE